MGFHPRSKIGEGFLSLSAELGNGCGRRRIMKITKADYEGNRRESRKFYINQDIAANAVKLIIVIAGLILIRLILMY